MKLWLIFEVNNGIIFNKMKNGLVWKSVIYDNWNIAEKFYTRTNIIVMK